MCLRVSPLRDRIFGDCTGTSEDDGDFALTRRPGAAPQVMAVYKEAL